jgi:eukaryotic-like serine/threonine-protein kinase
MVGKYGETLVVEWGLAKATGKFREPETATETEEPTLRPTSASGSAETAPGSAIGTPAFMSPEQAAGRLDLIGPASDVYSLGATLYALLTGKPPLEGKDVLAKVQCGDIPRPRQINAAVPIALEAVCLKAMALKPADRYASPMLLADDIERWLADEPVSAMPEPMKVKAGRWMRRHKPLVSGVAASLLVAVVGLTIGAIVLGQTNDELSTANIDLATTNKKLDSANTSLTTTSAPAKPNPKTRPKQLLSPSGRPRNGTTPSPRAVIERRSAKIQRWRTISISATASTLRVMPCWRPRAKATTRPN